MNEGLRPPLPDISSGLSVHASLIISCYYMMYMLLRGQQLRQQAAPLRILLSAYPNQIARGVRLGGGKIRVRMLAARDECVATLLDLT